MAAEIEIELVDGAGLPARRLRLPGPVLQVGRGPGNDLVVQDRRVSAVHGRLLIEPEQVRYLDLGSTNGSALRRQGKRLPVESGSDSGVVLQPGDRLLLGDADTPTTITLLAVSGGSSESTGATVVATRALGSPGQPPPAQTLAGLLELLRQLNLEADALELARRVLQFFLQAVPGAERAELFLKDSTGNFGPALAVDGQGMESLARPPSRRLLGQLEQGTEALLLQDPGQAADPSASLLRLPAGALVLAPLLVEGELLGAIQVSSTPGSCFGEAALDLVTVVSAQLAAVLANARLVERLRQAEARLRGERDYLRSRVNRLPALEEMVGRSPAMEQVRQQIATVAAGATAVLVQGETGTGKELVARAIHESSPRAEQPFLAVNCAALAPGLLESELFGHRQGAFTGALRERKGLLQVADGGTLFLDEIGELPLELQPKLLRCLEEGRVTPIGGTRPVKIDLRLVCASNRNLEQEVAAGRFRRDLFYRLNTFVIHLPPLRQRAQDIPLLAEHFLASFAAANGRPAPALAPATTALLQGHDWPGNVRELKNEMERALLLAADAQFIEPLHLSPQLGGGGQEVPAYSGTLAQIMERLEATVVSQALRRHQGNRTRCAKELGISRQALIAKIARLGLED